jgi:anti-sigma B factor antagonist
MKVASDRSVAILMFSGAIRPHQVYEIEDALSDLIARKKYKLIVDLGGAAHITSSALGVLARFAEVCRRENGELRLVATEQSILNLLQVTMLDKVFDVYTSISEAEEDF